MHPFFKKENSPDFSQKEVQETFVRDTQDSKALLQKELAVNQAEQVLLAKRLQLMASLLNDLPSSDPQYATLLLQLQMDQVELDELKVRATLLIQKLAE